jgi:type I restriction enzyme M protein
MVHQLDDNGTMAIVFSHGALFRGGAEGHIRQYLIKKLPRCRDWYACNIFFTERVSHLYFGLEEKANRCQTFCLDASQHFENQNVLRKEMIDKIISTFENRTEEDKYSHLAPLSEWKPTITT